MLTKSVFRRIKSSLGRYLAIFGIIALGVGFFAGLRVTPSAMLRTADGYVQDLRLFDFRLISTLGFTDEDVKAFSELPGVAGAFGSVNADFLYREKSGSNIVIRAHMLLDGCNGCDLIAGRMPERGNECVLDGKFYGEERIGEKLTFSSDNSDDTLKKFAYDEYTVTGIVDSVYYINFERGGSELGNGSVSAYVYVPADGFTIVNEDTDENIYTELFVKLEDSPMIYSDGYRALIDEKTPFFEKTLEKRADDRYEKLVSDAQKKIDDAQAELDDAKKELDDAVKEILDGREEIKKGEKEIEDAGIKLADARKKLDDGWAEYDKNASQLEQFRAFLPEEQYAALKKQLDDARQELDTGEKEYENGLSELEKHKNEIKDAEKELDDAERKTEDGRAEIADGQKEIDEAKEKINDIKKANVYVLDRSTNVGYACLENDTSIVTGVSRVFPLFFFIVSALVCTTTMTRMVDELRVENGVLKALGYGNGAIAGQYLFYSGSASLLGCVTGFLIGSKFMPMALWMVYHIMYSISRPVAFVLDWKLFFVCTVIYMVCSLGATLLVCGRMLREQAAELIRPKAPSAGKRIFLERMTFIWKRMKFLHKVSARNILRYKKRMFMMIIGIGGCTALLITGFGINDSIKPILDYQYTEIETYDEDVTFVNPLTSADKAEFESEIGRYCESITYMHTGSADVIGDKTENVNFMVYTDEPDKCFNLHRGKKTVDWPGPGECVVDFRLARSQGLSVGDEIELRDGDFNKMTFTVSGIYDNYIYDFLFVSAESAASQLGQAPEPQTAFIKLRSDADPHEISAKMLGLGNVAAVSINADMRARIGSMFESLDYIVLIVLVCAGALAFIVLFNLSNISITERTREIATLKVLGFNKGETAAYVFRENLVLTAISAVCGIPMGIWLLRYVMDQIKIKSMYFGWRLSAKSLIISIVMTFVFAVFAELFLTKKLENINMAESLKAIE